MTKSIDINLEGTRDELIALFAYPKELQASNLSSLEEYIAHAFNQTLVRDGYTGAWAEVVVVKDSGQFVLKMYSPRHDLGRYQLIIPAFLEAGRLAVSIFAGIEKQVEEYGKGQMRFVLPFGLSMANTKSIQLLHFPPLEAFVYTDYLYSPTNRRWENLLAYNHFSKSPMTELETIVDCVPIAAPGGDSKGIEPFNNSFTPYVKQMLKARLRYAEHQNTPILGYGEPVMAWLKDAFPDVIKEDLKPLSLVELSILGTGVKNPVLCANHPSKYLYYTDDDKPADAETKKEIMTQDLIAAGWQARMVQQPGSSPHKVLQEMKEHWTDNPQVQDIMKQEDEAYGYKLK
ncbi:MAG: hypothetical protein MUE58_14525 [Chitinophagaceae bacterium]|nr:hypothetical protein [Chitinophagaceae bacterium]